MDSSEQNVYSRRDFGKIVLAGLPLVAWCWPEAGLQDQRRADRRDHLQLPHDPERGGHHQGVRRRSA